MKNVIIGILIIWIVCGQLICILSGSIIEGLKNFGIFTLVVSGLSVGVILIVRGLMKEWD